jgi:hypothetical protein
MKPREAATPSQRSKRPGGCSHTPGAGPTRSDRTVKPMRHLIARLAARVFPARAAGRRSRTFYASCATASIPVAAPLPSRPPRAQPKYEEPLDGGAIALVRPYVIAHECAQLRGDRDTVAFPAGIDAVLTAADGGASSVSTDDLRRILAGLKRSGANCDE